LLAAHTSAVRPAIPISIVDPPVLFMRWSNMRAVAHAGLMSIAQF
jgi:hypothetical protein